MDKQNRLDIDLCRLRQNEIQTKRTNIDDFYQYNRK